MKIEGPGNTQKASSGKKSDKTSSAGGGFGDLVTGKSGETGGTTATRSISSVDALLTVQAAESPTERAARRRMRERADSILEELETIRRALLTGTLTVGHIIDIADVVASHRERVMDPRLTAILDEVDLRAQVELAKMRVALDKVPS